MLRGSSGGTGLYERTLSLFALDGFRIRPVFDTTEERQECPRPEDNCSLDHVITTFDPAEPPTLITHNIRISRRPDNLRDHQSWWVGIPPSSCKIYRWDAKKFKFVENTANFRYCRPVNPTASHLSQHHR